MKELYLFKKTRAMPSKQSYLLVTIDSVNFSQAITELLYLCLYVCAIVKVRVGGGGGGGGGGGWGGGGVGGWG